MPSRPVALVTGASGGLGAAFARQLAERGHDLVLTARTAASMEQLAGQLRREHGIDVTVEAVDLSETGSADELVRRVAARGLEPDILINNAGFGLNSRFVDHDPERLRAMLQVNVVTLTELTRAFGSQMAARGSGRILLVASMSAYQPNPLLAAYGATKAYVLSLGEAIHVELAPAVIVTVLSPGLMDTGFNGVAGFTTPKSLQRMVMVPDAVATTGLDALFTGKSGVIAGGMNKVMAFGSRLLSRHRAATIAAGTAGETQASRSGS